MAVSVEMHGAVVMAVPVKMHAIAPQPPQHMSAETDQHQSHGGLDRPRKVFRKRLAEQYRGPGNGEQCQRMAEPPGQAVLDDVADMRAARGDAGDRRDVIGLKRVLHAQQKPQRRNCEHVSPCSGLLTALVKASKQSARLPVRSHYQKGAKPRAQAAMRL